MRGDEPPEDSFHNAREREFPACAGMNRICACIAHLRERVPRMRGDEPTSLFRARVTLSEFPACAGMNRLPLVPVV